MLKKYTLIALCGIAPALGFGQAKTGAPGVTVKDALPMIAEDNRTDDRVPAARGGAIWMEDFNGAVNTIDSVFAAGGAWGKTGFNGQVWRFSTTPSNGCWSFNTGMPNVTTAANGFLLFDADSANCVDPVPNPPLFNQDALNGTIVSPAIDLSSHPSVLLSFEYESRWCCSGVGLSTLVEVSGDGGATWPASFDVEHEIVNGQQVGFFEVNPSSVMGGASEAMFRVTWDAQSHYYMVIDDIMITPAATNDLKILSAYVSHNNTGEEYGRIPSNQTDQTMLIGAEVQNFGASNENNVTLNADFTGGTPFAGSFTQSLLMVDSTTFLDDVTVQVPLSPGDYEGTFIVSSDGDMAGGPAFNNNTLTREFEVNDEMYSGDGIGVYSATDVSDLGTNSFTGGEDGYMMFAYYDVTEMLTVYGIEFLLGPNSSANAEVVVAIHDTLEIFADNTLDPIEQSDVHVITQGEVNAETVQVYFDDPVELEGNAFFAGVEMFSDGNTNDVEILDDNTVPQPGYMSMIYIPNDQVYSNGNAVAIRLILTDPTGINENPIASSVAVSPNPSNGFFTLELDLNETSDLRTEVVSVDGSLVAANVLRNSSGHVRTNMNLSELSEGVYFLRLITDTGNHTERIVITK